MDKKELKIFANMYCRLSKEIEDEPKDDIKVTLQDMQEKYKDIKNYKPYTGFYDLREFDLSESDFLDLWLLQDLLSYCENNKEIIKSEMPQLYSDLKELSASYQNDLLSHKRKEEELERESV